MITKVQKYLIFGVKEDLNLFYERAQSHGFIEFISKRKSLKHPPEAIQNLLSALRILKAQPGCEQSQEAIDPEKALLLVNKVLDLKEKIATASEEKRVWELEKARIAPFGDFSLKDVEYIGEEGDRKVQFFCAKSGKADHLLENDDLIFITREHSLDYFVSVSSRIKSYPSLTEMRLEYSLGELISFISSSEDQIHTMEKELKGLVKYKEALQEELLLKLNSHHLDLAKEDASSPLTDSSIFSVEAWIPSSKVKGMVSLLEGLAVHSEKVAIEEDDSIPTVMENTGSGKIGEDLVRFYDIPSFKDKDPSKWVFWSFAFFFAIIIGDGGYGLVFLTLAAYLKYKFKTFYGAGKRLFRLFVVLALFVVGWGVITNAFFGVSPAVTKKISPFTYLVNAKAEYHVEHRDDVLEEYIEVNPAVASAKTGAEFLKAMPSAEKDYFDDILLDLTLVVGIVHISCGFLRYARRNLAGLGWVVFLAGSYLFFPRMINATTLANTLGFIDKTSAYELGKPLVYGGFGLAVVLALVQQGWKGILEVMNVIQISADILSYLRLYALALASAIMAATFNDMGTAAGFAGGFLIVLAGQTVNIGLGTMSGVIHGLRLNFIEWYRHSFEGGGRIFNPLRILRSKED